ncbi:Uncharacterised protein [uncultured archaeon]|nr:Uncharacterised protein [uncultured archaeon]
MKGEKRFDPYHGNYSWEFCKAAIEIDNSKRSNDSRLDSVRELGELLERTVLQTRDNLDHEFGFYTIIHFRDAFQRPLEEYGYKIENHTQVEPFRKDLLEGISKVAYELTKYAYMPNKMQEKADNLMRFCNSLSRQLSNVQEFGPRYCAA